MSDNSSGRDSTNSGSDSSKHHGKGTAHAQFKDTPAPTRAVAPTAQVVRDLAPVPVSGSAVK
jgi:hypothetical protein